MPQTTKSEISNISSTVSLPYRCPHLQKHRNFRHRSQFRAVFVIRLKESLSTPPRAGDPHDQSLMAKRQNLKWRAHP